MKREAINMRVSVAMFEELKQARDAYFIEARKIDPEIRNGWKSFFIGIYREWVEMKDKKNNGVETFHTSTGETFKKFTKENPCKVVVK